MSTDHGSRLPVYLIHWRAPDWCRSAVASLRGSEHPVDVTVVDNTGCLPDIQGARVHRLSINVGYAGAANVALREWLERSTHEFCLIGSHDLHVDAMTLTRLLDHARQDGQAGIIGPNLGTTAARGRHITADRYEWISGTALLFRRVCVEDVGLFEELFNSYGEDVELCFRARAANWDIVIVDDARAHGLGSVHRRARMLRFANQPLTVALRAGGFAALRTLFAQPVLAVRHLVQAIGSRDRRNHVALARDRLAAFPRGMRTLFRWRASRRRREQATS